MSQVFDSARRKLERAERHFADLEKAIQEFTWKRPYEAVVEPHATKADHKVHKIRLTASLPPIIAGNRNNLSQPDSESFRYRRIADKEPSVS
jgi:hypothetical protein